MNKLHYSALFISLTLLACGERNQDDSEGINNPIPFVNMGDMSIGDDEGRLNKAYWDWMRFHDPSTGKIPENIKELELEFARNMTGLKSGSYVWEQRGPVNIGGRTRALEIDVLNENIWIAGGVTGGIWRSIDAGDSWTKVTAQDQIHSVTCLVQDTRPGKENIWYAGTGEYYTVVSHATWESRFSGNGIMKSTDNGLTWEELASTQSNTPETIFDANGDMDYVWKLVVDKSNMTDDVVLAAVFNGIYRSDDGGDTWTEAHGFEIGGVADYSCDMLDLVATDDGVFYATYSSDGVGKGVYRSSDGLSWTSITPGSYPGEYGRMVMAVNPLDQDVVWFFGDTDGLYGNGHSVFRYHYLSGDGSGAGGVWEDRSSGLPSETCFISEISFDPAALNTQSSFDVAIAIHPTDTSTIYIAGTSIWRNSAAFTTDTVNTWVGGYYCSPYPYDDPLFQTSYPNHHPDQHGITFLPSDPSKMINYNDGGIYLSTDCLADSVNWISKNNGYITTQFYGVGIVPGATTDEKIIGGMQDNSTFVTMYNEYDSAWVRVTGGDGMFCAITEDAEYYLGCSQYGRLFVYKLDAIGNPIAYERLDPEGGPSSYNWANSYKLDPNFTKRIYWNGRNKLWRLDNLDDVILSNDKTNKEPDHWVPIMETAVSGPAGIITDIEMCKAYPNTVWYGTQNGFLYRVNYADDDDAVIRKDITGDNFPNGSWLASIAVNPYDYDDIVVCFANYNVPSIFRTTDGGQSWYDISGNLEENTDGTGSGPSVLWVENYPDGTIFAGTSTGLYTTTFPNDSNTVWTLESGIGNVIINHMDYRTYDGRFVVGTHGRGVFSTTVEPVNVGVSESSKPQLNLYPTVATDYIMVEGIDGLDEYYIFNLNGQMIRSLPKTDVLQRIDVQGLRSGAYIFVARSGDDYVTRKFVRR